MRGSTRNLGRKPRSLPPRFFLLHTLAHILIRQLAFECGYGSSSLRERLYCWDEPSKEMTGLLIYTAAGDSRGYDGWTCSGRESRAVSSRSCSAPSRNRDGARPIPSVSKVVVKGLTH